MQTLQEVISKSNNRYCKDKKDFLKNINRQKIEKTVNIFFTNKGCSIITPFFDNNSDILEKCLTSIQNQTISSTIPIEIIVVDDSSPAKLKEKRLKEIVRKYPIVYIKLYKNQGRASARNLGLMHAKHDLVIFIDSDVVVSKKFIFSHLLFHYMFKNSAIVGFSCSIDSEAEILKIKNIKRNIPPPTYKKDFRYKKFVPRSWKKIYKNIPVENLGVTYHIFKESDFFLKMGRGKVFGVWDLPFMFITRNVSVMRKNLLRAGGFDARFKGWGMEDVHMGAKLIALGLYIIPNIKANCYHVIREGDQDGHKIKEFSRNLKLYDRIKREEFKTTNEEQWLAKTAKVFKGKFVVKNFYPNKGL